MFNLSLLLYALFYPVLIFLVLNSHRSSFEKYATLIVYPIAVLVDRRLKRLENGRLNAFAQANPQLKYPVLIGIIILATTIGVMQAKH